MVSIEFLQSHSLFGGVSKEALEKIRPLFKEKYYSKGNHIIREGEMGDSLYFIEKGSVEILKKMNVSGNEIQKRIAILREGETFGEMEIIDVQPRCASVVALEDLESLILSNADLYSIFHSDLKTFTMIIMNLAREISRRLRNMDTFALSSLPSINE